MKRGRKTEHRPRNMGDEVRSPSRDNGADLHELADPAAVREVRHQHLDPTGVEKRLESPARLLAPPCGDGNVETFPQPAVGLGRIQR
jgi:hypothetical protein